MRKFVVKVNGNPYEVEIEEINNGQKPAPAASPAAANAAASSAPMAAKPAAPAPSGSAAAIHSPMPGTILKIKVTQGEAIKKGQVLLILEAMKMENEIVSPKDATVAAIHVTKGASVNAGDLLVTLE